jgi:hypothetical protein
MDREAGEIITTRFVFMGAIVVATQMVIKTNF